jgi:hypothetical protein
MQIDHTLHAALGPDPFGVIAPAAHDDPPSPIGHILEVQREHFPGP